MTSNEKFSPNSSFAIAAIAERYHVDYTIALNYADAMLSKARRQRMNYWHIQAASQVTETFGLEGPRSREFYGFHRAIREHIKERSRPKNV